MPPGFKNLPPGFSTCLQLFRVYIIYGDYTTQLYVDDNKPFIVSLKKTTSKNGKKEVFFFVAEVDVDFFLFEFSILLATKHLRLMVVVSIAIVVKSCKSHSQSGTVQPRN